jgi:hypothetical protein
MALLDDIKKRIGERKAGVTVPSTTDRAQKLLSAKSGKAAGPAPALSRIGERVAAQAAQPSRTQEAAQTAGLLGAIQQQQAGEKTAAQSSMQRFTQAKEQMRGAGQRAGEARQAGTEQALSQLAGQESRAADKMAADYQRSVDQLASERGVATEDIFESFRQGDKELRYRKDAAYIEQVAHEMAMADKEYIQNLEMVGRERRLTDKLAFAEESAEIQLGSEMTRLLDELDFLTAYNEKDRDFEVRLKELDLDSAMRILETSTQQANMRSIVGGGGDVLSTGEGYDPYTPSNTGYGFDGSTTTAGGPR